VPLLRGRYELLERLGSGGEARVVKALDHQHARFVALKMRSVATQLDREDLLREATVLLGLTPHPSLPLVREDFFEGDQYVIVMDWVDGTDLARLVRDNGTPGLPLSSVLEYLAEAAEALTFLHTQQTPIIHGDVKPANMILTRGGHVKLVDFGLASRLGVEGQRRGTTGFRAPELESGAPPSRASDVFALTATAVALLTGAAPTGPPTEWDGLDAAQAARLASAISAGLADRPALRPSTPGELVERLRTGWASTLPTGVMTFCTSDIEGSTRLWESQPEAMAEALVRHDDLIAAAVEAHGGRFLKSMGEGDSTASVFESAGQALRAAIAATRELADEPWPVGGGIRVRFGLHTGEARRRGGVYFGTTPNLAARVRSAGGGGEILLSELTASLVAGDLPDGYAIVDLGPHHLKGIEKPEAIKALIGSGLKTAPAGAACPYRGLLAFEAHDRHLFFGREEVVADVLARIAPGRLLAVVGASGSGKSSLLRAGVLAAVQAGELRRTRSARLITPGAEPPARLHDDEHELLVVDQFEELYTQCRDPERRSAFIRAILGRSGAVVIGVRADFYGEMSLDPDLASAVAENQVLLGPMSDRDLRRAIAEPARLAGLRLEPGLIDIVLRDVAGEPGALPLMSHALRETWERRDGRTLTVAAYQESGGVSSAVAKTADAVVAGTARSDRALLRNVFLRLTEIGDDVEETRRRALIGDLVPQGASPALVRKLLERLAEARLVTLDERTAEVAHEVLIRRWPTLRRWLEEDREGIRLHRRLSDAARLWLAAGRESTDLYRGTRLDAAVEWARANGAQLNETEREFLSASVDESAQTHRRQLKANRRLRRALTGIVGLLLAAVALLAFALLSRHDAVRAEASARSQAIAAQAESQIARDPQRALLLARVALKMAPTPEAMLATSEALDANTVRSQLPSFGVQSCVTSNYMYLLDGGRVAVDNDCNGYVVFGDLVRRRIIKRIRVGHSSTDMTLSPTGRALIVATGHNLVSVDVRSGRVRHLFTAPFPIVWTASGPPGRSLAIGDTDTVGIVNLRRHRLRVIAHGDASVNPIIDMLWASPTGLLIETSGHTRGAGQLAPGLTVLDVLHGTRRTVSLPAPPHHLAALAFMNIAPDLRTWFVTGADISANNDRQAATTWALDARTRRVRWIARGPVGTSANAVNSSPDGRLIGVGYGQGAIDVLDATTGRLVVRDSSSASIAAGWMAFPPSNASMVTVSLDGVFRTWAAQGSEQLRLQAPADPAVDFTSGGRDLVLVGDRGEIVDRRTGRTVRSFPGFPAASIFNTCNSACFAAAPGVRWLTYLDPASSRPRIVEIDGHTGRRAASVTVPRLDAEGVAPDGKIVAAYVDGGRLFARLIDPRTRRVRSLQPGESSDGCAATTPSFTPDSRLMVIVDGCIHLVVWDLDTGRVKRAVVLPDRANASSAPGGGTTANGAHLSPDGRYALVAVEGGGLVRADLSTGTFAERPGTQTIAKALAISPNGHFYAIGRQDGTVDEYDARTMQLVRHHVLAGAVQSVTFSPDGRELAVEDTNNVVWIWDTCDICQNPTRLEHLAARETVRALTPSERATFGVR
jgi:class 3 adenylate cyclase/WD40 repeat protein/tRNA A-37 threonylcarbamoyl transferase component Bud32/energy-coupling factor transporter ATP-binding protein EcfA2